MFNQESTLVTILNKAADMVILSVLWCVCSLPVLTIGAASAALYHTSIRVLRQNRGYAFAAFRDSFKENLKQTIPFTALLLFLYALFGVTGYVCWQRPDSMIAGMYVFFSLFSILVCLTVQIHGFALMGRFHLSRQELFTLLVRLAFGHPVKNFLLLCLFLFAVELSIYYPPLLFIVPAGFFFLSSYLQEPVFKKHINYQEEDPLEDLSE
ncbi:DUF624 domain-containing protein [Eisenbergiella sp.]